MAGDIHWVLPAFIPGEDRLSERTPVGQNSTCPFVVFVVGRSETAGDLECLGTFHKLKLLKMKFVIGKKRGTSRF